MRQKVQDGPFVTTGTAMIAGLGVLFPEWWPSVEQLGLWFAPLVPILSVTWLALQSVNMVASWIEKRRARRQR